MNYVVVSAVVLAAIGCKSTDPQSSPALNLSSQGAKGQITLEETEKAVLENATFLLSKRGESRAGLTGPQHFDLAILLMIQGDYAQALRHIAQGRGMTGNAIEAARLAAEVSLREGKFEKAVAILESNGGTKVKNAAFLNTYANAKLATGNFEEADAAWQSATRLDPKDPVPRMNRKLSAYRSGNMAVATSISVESTDQLHRPLGALLSGLDAMGRQQYETSYEIFLEAHKQVPEAGLALNICYTQLKLGRLDDALASADALRKDPATPDIIKDKAANIATLIERERVRKKTAPVTATANSH